MYITYFFCFAQIWFNSRRLDRFIYKETFPASAKQSNVNSIRFLGKGLNITIFVPSYSGKEHLLFSWPPSGILQFRCSESALCLPRSKRVSGVQVFPVSAYPPTSPQFWPRRWPWTSSDRRRRPPDRPRSRRGYTWHNWGCLFSFNFFENSQSVERANPE